MQKEATLKVCLILEGSYPYVFGGVSSWTHQYIKAMPDTEFILWCIGSKSENRGKYKFELPENVTKVHEVFLDDALRLRASSKSQVKLTDEEIHELTKLLECEHLNWNVIFEVFQQKKMNPVNLLTSKVFLEVLMDICTKKYPYTAFADMFHTTRSMLLPELYLFTLEVPKADIYHATATGYSGLLGSLGKWKYDKPFILTEHGIYTREREEEILRAKWVIQEFKQQWIHLFYTFSDCAYTNANVVTALFDRANHIQEELGCEKRKLRVIENGIHFDRFSAIPDKKEDGFVDIGVVARIAKIKDIKTVIYAFAEVKAEFTKARLHILGDVDDKEYFEECKLLVQQLRIQDLVFTGVVNVIDYMEKLDFTVLSSISEGQPLSVLESFAAKRPCVTTDVGCCRDLIEGNEEDDLGAAGICVSPMHTEEMARAILHLCREKELREEMGRVGQKRAERFYTHDRSMNKYRELYREVYRYDSKVKTII